MNHFLETEMTDSQELARNYQDHCMGCEDGCSLFRTQPAPAPGKPEHCPLGRKIKRQWFESMPDGNRYKDLARHWMD